MAHVLLLCTLVAAALATSCGGRTTPTGAHDASDAPETVVSAIVTSGRPQPPAETTRVRVGASIVARVAGLGPPRLVVLGPDGARVPSTDGPLEQDGHVVGTEQRFVASQPGVYRLEQTEVPGQAIALVDAR